MQPQENFAQLQETRLSGPLQFRFAPSSAAGVSAKNSGMYQSGLDFGSTLVPIKSNVILA